MLTMFKRLASLIPTPATNKVTLFVSDTGIPSYKDDAGLVTPMSGQPIPAGYIDGLKMEWVSGTQIRFTSGSAYIPSLGRALALAAAVTKTPTLAANTWYHAYLYSNAGTPDVEVTTTAPDTPYSGTARTKTGDTSRRYIGSFRTNASAQVMRFDHASQTGMVGYATSINNSPLHPLATGAATTQTSVSLAASIPISGSRALLYVENSTSNGAIAYVGVPYIDVVADVITFVRPSGRLSSQYLIDSNQQIAYMFNSAPAASTGLDVWVLGYVYER